MQGNHKTLSGGCACGNVTQCCSTHFHASAGMRSATEFMECYNGLRSRLRGNVQLPSSRVYEHLSSEIKDMFSLLSLQQMIGKSMLGPKEIPETFAIVFLEAYEQEVERMLHAQDIQRQMRAKVRTPKGPASFD